MFRKKQVLAIAGVACIIVASLSVVYVAASPAWTIDDMVDYMEKVGRGKIWKTCYIVTNEIKPKVDDIYEKMRARISSPVTVWWREPVTSGDVLESDHYNASGFGRLHMLIADGDLSAGEELTVRLQGVLWNPAHTTYIWVDVGLPVVLTLGSGEIAITIPVPSEEFRFVAILSAGTSCYVYLSFYLTWA